MATAQGELGVKTRGRREGPRSLAGPGAAARRGRVPRAARGLDVPGSARGGLVALAAPAGLPATRRASRARRHGRLGLLRRDRARDRGSSPSVTRPTCTARRASRTINSSSARSPRPAFPRSPPAALSRPAVRRHYHPQDRTAAGRPTPLRWAAGLDTHIWLWMLDGTLGRCSESLPPLLDRAGRPDSPGYQHPVDRPRRRSRRSDHRRNGEAGKHTLRDSRSGRRVCGAGRSHAGV